MKQLIVDKVRSLRVLSLFVTDIVLINFSVLASLLLRFEFSIVKLEDSLYRCNTDHFRLLASLP